MTRNGKRISITLLMALFATGGLASCSRWQSGTADSIILSGNMELTQVNIAFKTSGKLIELAFDEGAEVRKGTVLGRLDVDQLLKQRARDQAALAVAESQLVQQQTIVEYKAASLEALLEASAAALRQAEARLEEMRAGSRGQDIRQAEAAVDQARTQQVLAQEEWDRAQVLYSKDDISTSARDQFKSRFESSRAALRQAEERLSLLQEGPRKEEIESAQAQVAQARANAKQVEASRVELKRSRQELETRRAQIDQARAQLAVIDSQIADGTVVAPIDGFILVKSAEAGEILAGGTPIVTLGDVDKPWLRGYIKEQDLGRIKLGMKAKVTTDSYPGKTYQGRISFIASEAEFTPKQIQTPEERVKLVYRIKIEIENPQHELKLNMPADAEILFSEN
jgi:HlyD family secretion protein